MKPSQVFKHIRFSWKNHFGVQFSTLTVLTATFTVIISLLSLSFNLKSILTHWGESIQITAYLKDDLSPESISRVESQLKGMNEFSKVSFVSKLAAQESFSHQMAKYSPNLLEDKEMANPFPANFQMDMAGQESFSRLQDLAKTILAFDGVEDVSYGEDWVENYSGLVSVFSRSGWIIACMLLIGSLFVVANSVRTSIMHRQDEIRILDLVGATKSMIVAPFVVDGALMGVAASTFALLFSLGIYLWGLKLFESNMAFLALTSQFHYLGAVWYFLVVFIGGLSSAASSYWCVRSLISQSGDESRLT
jgi:cell division transport system permease protein